MSTDSWKSEIYKNYSSNFGRKITEASYHQYIPMARHIIHKCFPRDKQIRIVDLGCGIGGFLKVFYSEGYTNISGVDVSAEEVQIAHQFGLPQVIQSDIIEWLKQSGTQSFDIILFLDVLEHFSRQEVISILAETQRVLREEGRVIIHVPNAEGIFGSRIRYADITHEQAFTYNTLSQICRHSGFAHFDCFEDKPVVHNVTSFFRRMIWEVLTFPFRLLFAAETGTFNVRLSQNILFKATK